MSTTRLRLFKVFNVLSYIGMVLSVWCGLATCGAGIDGESAIRHTYHLFLWIAAITVGIKVIATILDDRKKENVDLKTQSKRTFVNVGKVLLYIAGVVIGIPVVGILIVAIMKFLAS